VLFAVLDHQIVKTQQISRALEFVGTTNLDLAPPKSSDWLKIGQQWLVPAGHDAPTRSLEAQHVGRQLIEPGAYGWITSAGVLSGRFHEDAKTVGAIRRALADDGRLVFVDRFEMFGLLREAGLVVTDGFHVDGQIGPLDGVARRLARRLTRQPHLVCGVARPRSVFFGDSD
jgi:hypothetical protein